MFETVGRFLNTVRNKRVFFPSATDPKLFSLFGSTHHTGKKEVSKCESVSQVRESILDLKLRPLVALQKQYQCSRKFKNKLLLHQEITLLIPSNFNKMKSINLLYWKSSHWAKVNKLFSTVSKCSTPVPIRIQLFALESCFVWLFEQKNL